MLENGNNAMTVWLVGEFPQIFPCNGQLRKLAKNSEVQAMSGTENRRPGRRTIQ